MDPTASARVSPWFAYSKNPPLAGVIRSDTVEQALSQGKGVGAATEKLPLNDGRICRPNWPAGPAAYSDCPCMPSFLRLQTTALPAFPPSAAGRSMTNSR